MRGELQDNQETKLTSIDGEGPATLLRDGRKNLRVNTFAVTHGRRANGKIKENGINGKEKAMQHGAAKIGNGRCSNFMPPNMCIQKSGM